MTAEDSERKRMMALHRYGLLDSPPEAIFDGITVAIANICEAPIALVSLVDAHRQWFKSSFGLKVRETPRDIAFCDRAILRPEKLMVVEDAASDPRFKNNPLVTEDPNIRFYAGKPISSEDGYALGTLCVIDRKPRSLKPYQAEALEALGETVSAILQERYRLQKVAIDRDSVETRLNENLERCQHLYEDSESMLRGVLELLPSASVVVNPDGIVVSFNPAWTQFSETAGWEPMGVGSSYLDICENGAVPFVEERDLALEGIRGVLAGRSHHFNLEYASPAGKCVMQVQPVSDPASGALIQHTISAAH